MAASEGRLRFDRTLTSAPLSCEEEVYRIVRRHLLKSSLASAGHGIHDLALEGKYFDEVAQHYCNKIWLLLETLRSASAESITKLSASENDSGSLREWKLKDQNERHRVMYREGPVGTPFHTLCLDGVMDGQMANALCVGWEVPNYKDWFPQFTVPTFKITESKWLRKVRVGEALSLLRVKVPWPLAPREIVMSAFELEYPEEDIIVVLLESAPEVDEINEKLHGFGAYDIPAPSQNVRMNIYGGFLMQKINADQFFFRTVADLDMKLEFVPPWIINFVARQLAGQGLKLYQKTITAVGNGTGNGKVLQPLLKAEPLYERVRARFDAKAATDGEPFVSSLVERVPALKDSGKAKSLQGSILKIGNPESHRVVPFPVKAEEEEPVVENESCNRAEITQSPNEPGHQMSSTSHLHTGTIEAVKSDPVAEPIQSSEHVPVGKKLTSDEAEGREYEDPEVEWALTILDKMIVYSRTCAAGGTVDPTTPNNTDADKCPTYTSKDIFKPHVKISSSAALPTDATTTKARVPVDKRKPPATPVKNQNAKKEQVGISALAGSMKIPQRLVKQSPRMLLSSEEIELSGTTDFLSSNEIEVVSGTDDTDAETGESSRMSCPSTTHEPEVRSRRRRSRWRWGACFSPMLTSKRQHHRIKSGVGDSGRRSEGHWALTVGDSGRSLNQRGYGTDGDERYVGDSRAIPAGSDERFVTLGEHLMDDER